MYTTYALALLAAPLLSVHAQDDSSSPNSKRGLVYVVPAEDPADNHFWDASDSDLTWYYNYTPEPTNALDNDKLEFVPMQWGEEGGNNFFNAVKSQVDGGKDIKYVLGFNEPDGCEYGGSCMDVETAAQIWIDQIEPLKKLGITLGAPSPTGSQRGLNWMQGFFEQCDGKCNPDFFPAHWYGNFEGMASFLGQVNATYPNMTLWVTEFAYPEGSLEESQEFFNQSTEYLDRLEFCEKYSYFGSFRSDVSNVGANAALLTQKGELTDMGAWYLGQPQLAVGNIPKGDANQMARFSGWAVVVLLTAIFGFA